MNPPPGAWGRRRFGTWIGITLLVLYVVIAGGGGATGILLVQFRVTSLILLALVVSVWLLAAWRSPRWRPASAMWPAVVAIIVAFAVASVLSWNQRLSLEYLAYAVLLLTLYLILIRLLADAGFRPRLLALTGLLCGTIALLYLAIVLRLWIDWWGVVGHITTPPLRPGYEGLSYANPSAVAAIVVLFLAPTIAWFARRGRSALIGMAVLVGLVGITVVVTGSRGAWLALGLAITVTGGLGLVRPNTRRIIRARLSRTPRAGVVAILIAGTVTALTVGPAILKRLVEGGGDNLRVTLNLTALRMFAADPMTGSGPGTWVVRRAAFTEPQEVDYYIPYTHNFLSQGLAEFGLIGVAVGVIVLVALVRLIGRAISGVDPTRRSMAWAAIFSLVYLTGHQLVDSYMSLPAVLFAAILPVAFLDATRPAPEVSTPVPDRFDWLASSPRGLVVIGLACALALGSIARIESIALTATEAATAADNDDWAEAAGLAQVAAAADPDLPAYGFLAGIATAREDSPAARQAALALLRRSTEMDDYPQAWLNVAALELAGGDAEAARAALTRAMRLGWQQPAVSLPAGTLYLQLGDRLAALDAFSQALNGAPELTDDPFWETDPELADLRDTVVERAISTSASPAITMALLAGRTADARALAGALPASERLIAVLAVEAWAGDDSSQAALVELAEERPLDTRAVVWSAILAERDGDIEARDRFRLWAAITGGSLGSAIGEDVIVTDKPRIRSQVPGSNANFQGLYTYRRSYPWDLLVPGLPKLTKQ